MKTKLPFAMLLLACLTTINSELSCYAQGALTPPAGLPVPVMKTLDQVEARTPISSAPYTITNPGSYYLTGNLTVNTGNAININTNQVTLDLNGFTIVSTASSANGAAVKLNMPYGNRDVTILNGHIKGGVTNNGSGLFSGPGFAQGIGGSNPPLNTRVAGVSVSGCSFYGINVGKSLEPNTVESCSVTSVGSYGIYASTVKTCLAIDCGGAAILADQVSDSKGASTYSEGINCVSAQNCTGTSIGGSGIIVETAANCYGYSSSGDGLAATTAMNCNGYTFSGRGLAVKSAMNCYGESSTGTGIQAETASFCTAYQSGGTAIQATVANGCRAISGTNIITYKYNMP